MIYRVFPQGYDPIVAYGLADDYYIAMGVGWSLEETEHMRSLEKQASYFSERPTLAFGTCYEELTEEEFIGEVLNSIFR